MNSLNFARRVARDLSRAGAALSAAVLVVGLLAGPDGHASAVAVAGATGRQPPQRRAAPRRRRECNRDRYVATT
jgi:hypothetical protein